MKLTPYGVSFLVLYTDDMWVYYGLAAAFFLSLSNLCKKYSVKNNAVFPVLLITNLTSLLFLVPIIVLSKFEISFFVENRVFLQSLTIEDHFYIGVKSFLMTCSWVLAYYALKFLPLTIVTPIRASGPFVTVIGALLIYGERPTWVQWFGFLMIIVSMLLYSNIGKKEGIVFKSNKWIYCIVAATVFGSTSGLYDKFLMQNMSYTTLTVQWWFFVYVVCFMSCLVGVVWYPRRKEMGSFRWTWTVLFIGVLMVLADFCYLTGLADDGVMVMLMSAIKRSQVIFTVIIGGIIFKELNKRKKMVPLMGVLIGVACILYSK